MRRLLLMLALATATQGAAVKWEYAFLTDGFGRFIWTTPAGSFEGKLFQDLLPKLKCRSGTYPRLDFFNCVGTQDWEFVGIEKFADQETTYIFKRVKR